MFLSHLNLSYFYCFLPRSLNLSIISYSFIHIENNLKFSEENSIINCYFKTYMLKTNLHFMKSKNNYVQA